MRRAMLPKGTTIGLATSLGKPIQRFNGIIHNIGCRQYVALYVLILLLDLCRKINDLEQLVKL